MATSKITFFNIPEWAIYSLEYGIDECNYLSDEEINEINNFINEYNIKEYAIEIDWDNYKEFDINPLFGKPCKTYKVNFTKILQ